METYDDVVIGAGQGGLPAAHMAGNLGARVALIEMREVGGWRSSSLRTAREREYRFWKKAVRRTFDWLEP